MHFGFVEVAELLGRRGAKRDLRFAAGLGELDVVKSWFDADGSLKPGAGALADPYGQELKQRGQSPFRCERTRPNLREEKIRHLEPIVNAREAQRLAEDVGPTSTPSFPA